MGYQKGDQQIVIEGKTYGLRLTMGALAELNTRLSANGPSELSARLRQLSAADARVLLTCVMRPCLPPDCSASGACAQSLAASFSGSDIAEAMPAICTLFEQAFAHDG